MRPTRARLRLPAICPIPTFRLLMPGGAEGVEQVLRILQAELAEVMAITGAAKVTDIDGAVLAQAGS